MSVVDGITRRRLVGCTGALAAGQLAPAWAQAPLRGDGYAKLFGMNIGAKNYDSPDYQRALSRLDVVILGFYPGWKDRDGFAMRRAVQAIKRANPAITIGQYTILNEATDGREGGRANVDRTEKLDRENWWLREKSGEKVQWTSSYQAFDINSTEWTRPDANGDRYPQWAAKRFARLYFNPVAEFGVWFLDNVFSHSRVARANWKFDGIDRKSDEPEMQAAYRRGMAAHWDAARALKPDLLLVGNVNHDLSMPEYRGKLDGAFLEGLMGKSWSREAVAGWRSMMERYLGVRRNLLPPAIVAFNVHGRVDDFGFFRYAFASCLLGDGYFSFTDEKVGYSSVPWFDEYDVHVGKAVDAVPTEAWSNGVWRRRYEAAMAVVNPEPSERRVTIERGWRRVRGTQAGEVNDGSAVGELALSARSGLLLVKS